LIGCTKEEVIGNKISKWLTPESLKTISQKSIYYKTKSESDLCSKDTTTPQPTYFSLFAAKVLYFLYLNKANLKSIYEPVEK
jgi:hypothetical protein